MLIVHENSFLLSPLLVLMRFSEFQKYKDDILKFIDDIDGLEKEIAERMSFFNKIWQNMTFWHNYVFKCYQFMKPL